MGDVLDRNKIIESMYGSNSVDFSSILYFDYFETIKYIKLIEEEIKEREEVVLIDL